jgi:hypothetical protein
MLSKNDCGAVSNIDPKQASNAQDRFKKSSWAIRLLRVVKVRPTFSTTSTHYGLIALRRSKDAGRSASSNPLRNKFSRATLLSLYSAADM